MVNFSDFFLVFVGGGMGSALRFYTGVWILQSFNPYFPIGTLVVNLIGCFLLGLILGIAETKNWLGDHATLLLGTGFCGGFTTFSTFSVEANELLKAGQWLMLAGYLIGSVGVGIFFAYLGYRIGK